MRKTTVVYCLKENGVLIDKSISFYNEDELMSFIHRLKTINNLIGKPLIKC